MKVNCSRNTNGFTLLEVIGAVFIVSVGIIGVFSLFTQTISLLDISSDKLIAAYLVQEGIEKIKNIRDSNVLKGDSWDKDIAAGSSYDLDYQSSKFPDNTCNLGSGNYLRYNSDNQLYNCSSANSQNKDSRFKRQTTVIKPATSTLEIVVRVEWSSKNRTHQITGQDNFYDWQ